jgi:hypothetical protein
LSAWRRWGGRARRAALWSLCAGATAAPLSAQLVGIPPERSPFHDITEHQSLVVFGGRFAGNSGAAGVGALPGLGVAGRLAVRLSGPVDFWLTVGEASSMRRVLSAGSTSGVDSVRLTGTPKMTVVLADIALALNLTGSKSWHGLAPYVGVGLGVASPAHAVTDSSGFRFGVTFTLVPTLGTRLFLSRRLALHFEARDYYFRYQYPLAFFDTPYVGPPPSESVLPLTAKSTQWAHNFTLWIGAAYLFTF